MLSIFTDSGVIIMWITLEPLLCNANMIEGPHMLQFTHEGLPPPTRLYSIHVNHPAHRPFISLPTTVVLCVVVVRGSTTLMSFENLSFALETSIELPRTDMLATTGSMVHAVTQKLLFDHLPKVMIRLTVSLTSRS